MKTPVAESFAHEDKCSDGDAPILEIAIWLRSDIDWLRLLKASLRPVDAEEPPEPTIMESNSESESKRE